MTDRENPYTVAQLIAELQKLPQDMRVMVEGYEGGFDDASAPTIKTINRNYSKDSWWGAHEEYNGVDVVEDGQVIKVAVLGRRSG